MPNAILALNAGSSSIKFGLYEIALDDALRPRVRGEVEDLRDGGHFLARSSDGLTIADERLQMDQPGALRHMLEWIEHHLGPDRLTAVGHRIVHGGSEFTRPVLLDREQLERLKALTPLAPLHQPRSLSPIEQIFSLRPDLPQIAAFDTAFHKTMSGPASRFAIPLEFEAAGMRRYGFHGLSYEYIASELASRYSQSGGSRTVVAHLGNGASLCAMRNGRSIDTTMGLTALDGLVMGTRCGSLDPGVVLYLQQVCGKTTDEVQDLLYHRSGLLGISGLSSDMRVLLSSPDPRSQDAVEMFVFSVARHTAAMASSLGGLDRFVFTGGIGEHSREVRSMICNRLQWLGVKVDERTNAASETEINTPGSLVEVLIVPANEEVVIATHAFQTLKRASEC